MAAFPKITIPVTMQDRGQQPGEQQNTRETRVLGAELRLESVSDGKPRQLVGYAAVTNSLSVEMHAWVDGMIMPFRERIEPGAFARADMSDVEANIDHNGGLATLGHTANGMLELREFKRGLQATITPPDTSAGRDAITLVERRDLRAMSFAFNLFEGADRVDETKDGLVRTIPADSVEVVYDVTLTGRPAYKDTIIQTRAAQSIEAWVRSRRRPPMRRLRALHLTDAEKRV
ncbi:MAG: HK97 family phage prohead protease [Phycisphaerae bacterium]|nr:HK97 family phage prohead protease [Phycisphaerae bacterium]